MIRLGITGTDTGVGKTVVSCALAAGLRKRGLRVAAMKPIETGVTTDDKTRDGARLARAAGGALPLSMLSPITYREPIAPLIAARNAGSAVDLSILDHAVRAAESSSDALIVEGAGGILVPITDRLSFDELFARWTLDLVIVAANRLGTINHARLTLAAARRASLPVRAIVLNQVTAQADLSARDNARVIAELEDVPVVELPWMANVDDLEAAFELLRPHVFTELEFSR